MSDHILKLRCLEQRDLARVLPIQALAHDKTTFLATHTPIRNLDVVRTTKKGVDYLSEPSDQGVLRLLLNAPEVESSLMVVRGSKGSGKSHLIKWLYHKLRSGEGAKPIFLERSDSSLRSTIERLLEEFGESESVADLRQRLSGISDRLTETGREIKLLDELAMELTPGAREDSPLRPTKEELSVIERCRLPHLLRNDRIRRSLVEVGGTRPGFAKRLLDKLLPTAQSERRAGAVDHVHFDRDDLAALYRIPDDKVSFAPTDYDALRTIRQSDDALKGTVQSLIQRASEAAIQHILKIEPSDLVRLFKDLRERIYPRRLLLLIEDVSVFQGVDQQLLESLIPDDFHSEDTGGKPRSPILSVIGITDEYFRDVVDSRGNFSEDRITYHIRLTGDHDPSASALRGEGAVEFAARYLNILRHEPEAEAVRKWASDHDALHAPPSSCEHCSERMRCHMAFEYIEIGDQRYGLFPFNRRALISLTNALQTLSGVSEPTPRNLMSLIRETVMAVKRHKTFPFPSEQIFGSNINTALASPISAGRRAKLAAYGHDTDRTVQLLRWWGDGSLFTDETEDGRFTAGIHDCVFETFGLKPPAEIIDADGERPGPAPQEPEQGGVGPKPRGTSNPKSDPRREQAKREFEDLQTWVDGGDLVSAPDHRKRLFTAAKSAITWETHGIPKWFGEHMCKEKLVGFEGVARGSKSGRPAYEVARNEETRAALEALGELDRRTDTEPVEPDTLDLTIGLIANARDALIDFVCDRLPSTSDGEAWDAGCAAVRLLYLDRICRKPRIAMDMERGLGDLVHDLLWDPTQPRLVEGRSEKWDDLLRTLPFGTDAHDRLVGLATKWLGLTQGSGGQRICMRTAHAIRALRPIQSGEVWVPFDGSVTDLTDLHPDLGFVAELEKKALAHFISAISAEREHAGYCADELEQLTMGCDAAELLSAGERLQEALIKAGEELKLGEEIKALRLARKRPSDVAGSKDEAWDPSWAANMVAELQDMQKAADTAGVLVAGADIPWEMIDAVCDEIRAVEALVTAAERVREKQAGPTSSGDAFTDAADGARSALRGIATEDLEVLVD
jgi:hypothetical protein